MKDNYYYKIKSKIKAKAKEKEDYGICPEPTNAQKALDEIKDYLLGEDWIVWFPIGVEQVNTCIVDEIKRRYKPKMTFKEKLYRLVDKINNL